MAVITRRGRRDNRWIHAALRAIGNVVAVRVAIE